MKIKVLEERLSSDGFLGEKGDVFTVPDHIGEKWCGLGWAEDVAGQCKTGERCVRSVTVNPKKLSQQQSTKEVSNG